MRTTQAREWLFLVALFAAVLEEAGVVHAFVVPAPPVVVSSPSAPTSGTASRHGSMNKISIDIVVSRGTTSNSCCSSFSASRRRRTTQLHLLPPITSPSSSFWLTAAVEVFDGSDIVDPIVVSNVFWTSLQTKIVSFVIGQILAAAVFSILLAVFASQFGKLTSFVSEQVFPPNEQETRRKNQKNGIIQIPPELQKQNRGAVVQPDLFKLLICILVDTVGASSELVPILGELTDVVWAPIAGLILRQLYGGGSNNLLWGLEFAEEILPFTDVLPLCTLCWVVDTYFGDSRIAQVLQLGQYAAVSASAASTAAAAPKDNASSSRTTTTSTSTSPTSNVIDIEPEDIKKNVGGRR